MRILSALLLTILVALGATASNINVIPQPASCTTTVGTLDVPAVVTIAVPHKQLRDAATVASMQMRSVGIDTKVKKQGKAWVSVAHDTSLDKEQYSLEVTPTGVNIKASDAAGAFYALHTLRQLVIGASDGALQCCNIVDKPRFDYRGIMLDVSRYFAPIEEVKRIVDIASQLKISKLHLHLTDDNGWRMEIKRYPLLAKVGAWRVARKEMFPGRLNQREGEEATEGGYYTQSQLKDLVKYASQRYVEIIPEIEMPAHSVSALAAYPELACPTVDKKITVLPGIGGNDSKIVFCAGNDNTYKFFENVLDEVLEVFPSEYIHIGGDEANKEHWNKCPLCQKRIADEHLADSEALQGYFMDRVNRYLQSKGRKAMGWDEVTLGKPKEDIVVFGWQGMGNNAVKFAAQSGRRFVMTPARKLYLIRYQGPQWFEPFTYFGDNTLSDVFNYEPVQSDWTPQVEELLMGVQASMWTEFCTNPQELEYMLFPRMMAFADLAWRPKGASDWASFERALDNYLPQLDTLGVTYAKSMFNLYHKVTGAGSNRLEVELSCIRDDVEIRYTLDGSEPTATSPVYKSKLGVASNGVVKAASFRGGEQMGKVLTLDLNFNKATGCSLVKNSAGNALDYALTNGLRGSKRCSDFEWAGWHNSTAEFTLDLGAPTAISSITLCALANSTLCVGAPAQVSVYVSTDNYSFTLLNTIELDHKTRFSIDAKVVDIDFGKISTTARYVKFVATNPGCVPQGFARENTPTWMYFDEVIIK